MTKNQKSKLERYAELKVIADNANKEIKELQDDVFKVIEKQGKTETPFGTFILKKGRTTYTYSEKINKMVSDLKIAKIVEEEKGIATKVEGNQTMSFNIAKI